MRVRRAGMSPCLSGVGFEQGFRRLVFGDKKSLCQGEVRVDYPRPENPVNVLKALPVWFAVAFAQPPCIGPVSILNKVAYLMGDRCG